MEGQAGAGDQPFGPLAGEAVQSRGLGDAKPDRGDAGRAWLAGVAGDGRRLPRHPVRHRDARTGPGRVITAAPVPAGRLAGDLHPPDEIRASTRVA
jgi:hypothetical protein